MSQTIPISAPGNAQPAHACAPLHGFIRLMTDHETLYDEGDDAEFVYEVVSGAIKEYATLRDGRRQIMRFHVGGDLFGFADNGVEAHSAESIGRTKVRCYPYTLYVRTASGDPSSALHLIETLTHRQIEAEERLMMLGCMSALQRVARFLEDLAARQPGEEIALIMSRRDISEHLGLTPETVCRCIAELKKAGAIEMPTARRLRVTAPGMLRAFAEDSARA